MIATELTQLGVDMVVASARVTRMASRDVSALPHAAMRLLGRLDELGPTRISELAKADRCSQPTMSNLVQRQEEQGWVRREADPTDSRASLISLTDAGYAELQRARQEAGAAVATRLRQLPATDLTTLEAAVAVMRKILTLEPLEDSPR
ncbi:DNA-binding MarR family transcriptional regulator [Kribbella steppae]|uniref:DNA-binding MarR family transcriptional regulator n=1 Tax=Kribbella steppae TaxID=2512223 RepID=A0A4R2HL12_9ACTN|nr:MarR family transcriptional regulator [Kribbella steppae]TCO30352.1 DNA-binding MarR family transcriptional regulator [Kribbella steppae]